MRNLAMLYKMKEALEDFRAAYNRMDSDWQEWTNLYLDVSNVITVHDLLVEMEFDILNLTLEEVNKAYEQREVKGSFKRND